MDFEDWLAKHVAALRELETWKHAVTSILPEHVGGGCVINVDGARVIAQFVVWPTGEMEATALAIADGEVFYMDVASSTDEGTLEERWISFCAEILRVEEMGR